MGDSSLDEDNVLKKLEEIQELYSKGHVEAAKALEKNVEKTVKYTPMKENVDQAMELIKEQQRGMNPNGEAYILSTGGMVPDRYGQPDAKVSNDIKGFQPADSAKGGADGTEDEPKRVVETPKPRPSGSKP